MNTNSEKTDAAKQQENSKPRVRGRPFKPGQSGNVNGRPRGRVSLRASIGRVLSKADAEAVGQALIKKARRGDVRAAKVLSELLGETGAAATVNVVPPIVDSPPNIVIQWPHEMSTRQRARFVLPSNSREMPNELPENLQPPPPEKPDEL